MTIADSYLLVGLALTFVILTIAGLLQSRHDGRKIIAQAQEIQRIQNAARHGYGRSWRLWSGDRRDL